MEKQYLRYEGESQRKNTDFGDRGRKRKTEVTWGAPRTLRERKEWGKIKGCRRDGEPVHQRTYSDCRRLHYEQRRDRDIAQGGPKVPRLQRELRREEVAHMADQRNARAAIFLYGQSVMPRASLVTMATRVTKVSVKETTTTPWPGVAQGKFPQAATRAQGKGRSKVTRASRQKRWGRGEGQRRDHRGLRKVSDRSVRTEVSQAGGVCVEQVLRN